jgi:hypothetical protein
MKISLLLRREPFVRILEETLSSFLSEYYDARYTVKWFTRNQRKNTASISTGQWWRCNPLINSIYAEGAEDVSFNAIMHEYTTNPIKPWRSILQRFYIYLATKTKLGSVLVPYFLLISPEINNSSSILIIGGNNKIRVIDSASNTVFVILKKGFDKKYLEREIQIRQEYDNLPVPPVKQTGKTGWYSERMICEGCSPDRMDKDIGDQILIETSRKIHQLLIATALEEELGIYINKVVSNIKDKLKKIAQISVDQKRNILQATESLVRVLEKNSDFETDKIYTAITHGDFQTSNILYDGKTAWILDWEFSRRRQVGNDILVLILMPRNPKRFGRRFLNLLYNEPEGINKQLLTYWPFLDWKDRDARKISLILFLLEETDFLLEENENPFFYGEALGLSPFVSELQQILKNLTEEILVNKTKGCFR